MAVIQLTAREFREKQASIFNLLDAGEKVIIRRGKKKSYTLVPLEDDMLEVSSLLQDEIDIALKEIENGESVTFDSLGDVKSYFDQKIKCIK